MSKLVVDAAMSIDGFWADESGDSVFPVDEMRDNGMIDELAARGDRIGTTIYIPEGEEPGDHFRPDGKELLTGGSDTMGTLYWDLDPRHWLNAACRQAGRNLTADEWASYIGDLAPYRPTCPGWPTLRLLRGVSNAFDEPNARLQRRPPTPLPTIGR